MKRHSNSLNGVVYGLASTISGATVASMLTSFSIATVYPKYFETLFSLLFIVFLLMSIAVGIAVYLAVIELAKLVRMLPKIFSKIFSVMVFLVKKIKKRKKIWEHGCTPENCKTVQADGEKNTVKRF